jgi:putative ABC transport system substrate-binding protein
MPALAQQASSLPLVALLLAGSSELIPPRLAALRKALQQAGLIEGVHYRFAVRAAAGQFDRLPALAKELQALNPTVYVTAANATYAARELQPQPPIVFTALSIDPVETGLAKSYTRPGGMMTGNVMNAIGGEDTIAEKRVTHFKDLVPKLTRLGLIGRATQGGRFFEQETNGARMAGARLGFEVTVCGIEGLDEVERVVSAALRDGVDGFYISGSPFFFTNMQRVLPPILATGKPTVGTYVEWCQAGVLMSYASDLLDGFRRAGAYVARILQGTKPGDLPIEQADRFTLAINAKTAKLLGLDIPTSLYALADEIIE